jgi:hypothetical protein
MKSSGKTSFLSVFLFVFFLTLLVTGTLQAIFWTLRWYNTSEQSLEQLQQYPIYSVSEGTKPTGTIRVFIAPKPTTESNSYTFIQESTPRREEVLATVPPEKAVAINQKIQDVLDQQKSPATSSPAEAQWPFQSPVEIRMAPEWSIAPTGYLSTMDTVLVGTYFREKLWAFPLTVDMERLSPRGQMSNESVTMSGRIKSLSEMSKVLVHELGHMIDIYLLKRKWTTPDPSKIYYAISWKESTVLRPGMTPAAFVSGYAATNQYEDFAETFTMYVFHNAELLKRAADSEPLQKKYDFLRDHVFGGYFQGTEYEKNPIPATLWDVTKIVIKTTALREIFTQLSGIIETLL